MDEAIKKYLKTNPGLSANKIFSQYKENNIGKQIRIDTIFMRLRKLKQKGILLNKGNRWYVNSKSDQA